MGFKEDADFARFVSMGAVGTAAVASFLRDRHLHQPIELERYAMANKVWQTKVKRLRLPDLVCARCGRRVESRAKSKLGIILSHSDVPLRGWDAGGMRDDDLYAFLRADLATFPPYAGAPAFFTTGALRAAIQQAKRSAPKAASEGSEVTLTWPTWVPGRSGVFVEVDDQSRVVCAWDDGGSIKYWQWRRWPEPRFVYLAPGQRVEGDETIVAGVVAPEVTLDCPGEYWDLAVALESEDPAERYAAIKAAGVRGRDDLARALAEIAQDGREDWRISLEALASLGRFEPDTWTDAIVGVALGPGATPEQQMEAVFVLSEIRTQAAGDALAAVSATPGVPVELRAAAAWGLGQGVAPRPDLLLPMTLDEMPLVALHAITAFEDLPDDLVPTLVTWMGEDDHRAAIGAQLLQRHRKVDALLRACDQDESARLWALRALGDLPPTLVRLEAGDRLTPRMAELLHPMWRGQDDWLRTEGKEGIEALDVQKVRSDPANPGRVS